MEIGTSDSEYIFLRGASLTNEAISVEPISRPQNSLYTSLKQASENTLQWGEPTDKELKEVKFLHIFCISYFFRVGSLPSVGSSFGLQGKEWKSAVDDSL